MKYWASVITKYDELIHIVSSCSLSQRGFYFEINHYFLRLT